ncbi:MAG TPA: DnaJ domain-containing protein [Candidatus Saccharimonadales bacterium]|nr:DnaJ domain-containing protein [Candidatus Saccharimonadales bacterium]
MLKIDDFYRVLQVDPAAEPEVIRAAYRALARKYHPDVSGGSDDRMVPINRAWAVLANPVMRAAYDRGRGALAARPPVAAPHETHGTSIPSERPPGRPSGTVLTFGRYEGWSLGQLAQHDPDFLEWFARAPIGRAYRAEIDVLLAARGKARTGSSESPRTHGPPRR